MQPELAQIMQDVANYCKIAYPLPPYLVNSGNQYPTETINGNMLICCSLPWETLLVLSREQAPWSQRVLNEYHRLPQHCSREHLHVVQAEMERAVLGHTFYREQIPHRWADGELV